MSRRPPHPPRPSTAVKRWSTAASAAFASLTAEAAADGARPGDRGRSFDPDGADHPADPVIVERDPRALLRRLGKPAASGLLASIAITYGASQFGSPFSLKVPGAWFFGVPPITTPPGREVLLSLVVSYGGMFLLVRAWLEMLRVSSPYRGVTGRAVPVGALGLVAVLWLLPLLLAPPLFSQDVYSYAAQGQMVTQGINPYVHGPDALGPNSPYYPLVDQLWGAAPAPYGPLFVELDAGINNLVGHNVLAAVVGLRLLSLLGVGLLAVFLPMIARSLRRDAATVFTLAVLNPVTLLHLVAGAHNDALMLGLLAAGLALALRKRPVWAIVLCTMAAAVKVPAALGVAYVGWHWLGQRAGWRERIRPLVTAGLTAVGLLAVLTAPTGLGWGWAKALDNPSVVRSVLDPVTALGMLLGTITHALHLPIGVRGMLTFTRSLGLLTAVGAGVWLLLASNRLGMVKAIGTTLLLVVLLGPVVQPWYLAWGIILLAPVAFGRWRLLVVGATLVGSFIGFPGGVELVKELGRASLWSMALALVALLVIPVPPLVVRVRQVLARTVLPAPDLSTRALPAPALPAPALPTPALPTPALPSPQVAALPVLPAPPPVGGLVPD